MINTDKIISINSDFVAEANLAYRAITDQKILFFAKGFFHFVDTISNSIKKVEALGQIWGVISVPVNLLQLFKACHTFPNNDIQQKIDATLYILNKIRELGEVVSTYLLALRYWGKLTFESSAWLSPFASGMSFLGLVSIVDQYRSCLKTRRLINEIVFIEKSYTSDILKTYCVVMDLFEKMQKNDQDFFQNSFNADPDKFAEAFINLEFRGRDLLNSADSTKQKEGLILIRKSINSLKGRLNDNIISSVLAITSSSISMIGSFMLLILPGLPTGLTLIGVATALGRIGWVHYKICDYKFAKQAGFKRTTVEKIIA